MVSVATMLTELPLLVEVVLKAAVVLAVNTLAPGRDVLVSRGELVEIGGLFRVAEMVERSGGRLREVGATNRTHARDFQEALGPDTGLILRVHRSNFRVEGFTAEVPPADLAGIGRRAGVPVVHDQGQEALRVDDGREDLLGDDAALQAGRPGGMTREQLDRQRAASSAYARLCGCHS